MPGEVVAAAADEAPVAPVATPPRRRIGWLALLALAGIGAALAVAASIGPGEERADAAIAVDATVDAMGAAPVDATAAATVDATLAATADAMVDATPDSTPDAMPRDATVAGPRRDAAPANRPAGKPRPPRTPPAAPAAPDAAAPPPGLTMPPTWTEGTPR